MGDAIGTAIADTFIAIVTVVGILVLATLVWNAIEKSITNIGQTLIVFYFTQKKIFYDQNFKDTFQAAKSFKEGMH